MLKTHCKITTFKRPCVTPQIGFFHGYMKKICAADNEVFMRFGRWCLSIMGGNRGVF